LGALGATAAFDSFVIEPRWLEVTTHEVPVSGLPRELDGFTIAQVTDAHLGELGVIEAAIGATLRARDVQLLALTGDIIDSAARLNILKDFCSSLRKRGMDVVATLGNWEHWGEVPPDALRRAYMDLSVRLLVNEEILVERGVNVVATDDSTAGTPDLHRAPPRSAALVRVLLTHSPRFFDTLPTHLAPFHLSLAGHTHGGQVRLTEHFAPVRPQGSSDYVSGWYDTRAGRSYVSRGTGTSIVPARFSCRPELPLFTLRQG
jgi:hypothetical protein